jgi:hypothetical protein
VHILTFSRPARLLLIYGLFSVICHAVAILLVARTQANMPPDLMFHIIFPLLEHSIMSFVLVLFGAIGIEYVYISQSK